MGWIKELKKTTKHICFVTFALAFFVLSPFLIKAEDVPLETADSLIRAGATEQAFEFLQYSLTDSNWRAQSDYHTIAQAFLKIANLFYEKRVYDSAKVYCDSALDQAVKTDPPDKLMEAEISRLIGRTFRRMRRPEEAIPPFEKAVVIYRSSGDSVLPELAKTLNLLALVLRDMGKIDSSIVSASEAIRISEGVGRSEDKLTAQYCNTLARAFQILGQFEKSIDLYNKALNLSIPILGEKHPELTYFYNNLGNVYSDMGRFSDALANYNKALTLREEQLGTNHLKVGQSLSNIALVYADAGEYAEAESRLIRALRIFRTQMGERHEYVGAMDMNLGALYLDQRRFADAEEVLLDGKSIFEEINPKGHPQLAGILNNLAIVCRNTDRNDEAEAYLNLALELKTARYGDESPQVASTLNSLGVLEFSRGRYLIAGEYLNRSLSINRKVFGETHPEVGAALLNLGELSSRQNDWSTADSLLGLAAKIWETGYGSDNRWVAEAWERQAISKRRQGDLNAAWGQLTKAFEIRHKLFIKNARVLSEPDALAFSTFLRNTIDLLLSVWTDLGSSPSHDAVIAQAILASKGIVWDELRRRTDAWLNTNDTNIIKLNEQLRLATWKLARAYIAGPSDSPESFRRILDSLSQEAEVFESQLVQRDDRYREHREVTNPEIKAVAEHIPENSVLVEYFRFAYQSNDTLPPEDKYLAVVLKPDFLKIVSIGNATQIDKVIDKYRRHLQAVADLGGPLQGDIDDYYEIAAELSDLVLSPVIDLILPEQKILFAPDGPLCLVAWAGLLTASDKYLIEEHDLGYLGSGRDLLLTSTDRQIKKGLLAVGDVNFGPTSAPTTEFSNLRNNANGMTPVGPLEGSRQEINAITAAWKESCSEQVKLLMKSEATETAFKENAPHFRVLHLATHGFYSNTRPLVGTYALIDFAYERPVADNPLLHSGLYFAGVNAPPSSIDAGTDDGILTALEVSSLALDGTEIVVLSACESGLGDVIEGEGVSGLRRAFHLAGVTTVVSALWSVSDKQTAQLMRNLYSEKNLSMSDQLVKYQRRQLESLRQNRTSDHPFYWAPFIAINRR